MRRIKVRGHDEQNPGHQHHDASASRRGYTVRVEKDFRVALRNPSGKVTSWGVSGELWEKIGQNCARGAKLDLRRVPTTLAATLAHREAFLAIQDALSKLAKMPPLIGQDQTKPDNTILLPITDSGSGQL